MGKLADLEAKVFETEERLRKDMDVSMERKILWGFYKNIRAILDFEESETPTENLSSKQSKIGEPDGV